MKHAKAFAYESLRGLRAWLNNKLDAKWDNDPFGKRIRATREEYLALYEQARSVHYPEVDAIEAETGFAVDRAWLDELALHTQIVKKKSALAYPHGRLLYSLLRKYLADSGETFVSILETGTARGFSALCMAKALADARVDGRIMTLDVLPHTHKQLWNCIDDHAGMKSRAELLAPWSDLTRKITFLQGDTLYFAPRIGYDRINFAFLDAQHIHKSVMAEFAATAPFQKRGDVVFFDDVTPTEFPGVVAAVDEIESRGDYAIRRLKASEHRGYAWGVRR